VIIAHNEDGTTTGIISWKSYASGYGFLYNL